jgi:DNA-binding response OmpR family regulator
MAKILLVDDDRDIVKPVNYRLEKMGYEVLTACDGQSGYVTACKEMPDLIMPDLMIPKMDGYKVCSMLKEGQKYKSIPSIMLTARGRGLDMERIVAYEFGADAYITKPLDTELLLSKIKELISKKTA